VGSSDLGAAAVGDHCSARLLRRAEDEPQGCDFRRVSGRQGLSTRPGCYQFKVAAFASARVTVATIDLRDAAHRSPLRSGLVFVLGSPIQASMKRMKTFFAVSLSGQVCVGRVLL